MMGVVKLFEPGRYAAIPYTILRLRGLTPGAKNVWQSLASHLGKDGSAPFPSMTRLASMTGQGRRTVVRQVGELESAALLAITRTPGKSNRYRLLQPQAGLFDGPPGDARTGPGTKGNPCQSGTSAKTAPVPKCHTNYIKRLCTDTDTEGSGKRTSCPKVVTADGNGSERQAPGTLFSASVSANDGRRRGELMDRLARAIRLQAGGLRTEARLTQFRVDCVALEGFLDLALNGRLGPVPQACDALLAKAENLGRSTVNNRMAALTAWVQDRQGIRKRNLITKSAKSAKEGGA